MPLDTILKALDKAKEYWGYQGEVGIALASLPLSDDDAAMEEYLFGSDDND